MYARWLHLGHGAGNHRTEIPLSTARLCERRGEGAGGEVARDVVVVDGPD
jgi:hypothetical protein